VLGRVVDRVGDSCVVSSVVHPPYIGQVWHGREGGDPYVLISTLVDASLHVIMI